MPVFNLTLPRAVKALLEKFPPETLQPGDVLITNDPWLCAGHLFDIAVVTPVFRDGALVALTGTVGHVGDIGGTKDSLRAREIYEEGIQIPPMMLYRAGVPNDDLFTLIAENVRKSEEVLGDIHSFVAANALGAERLLAFMDDYGMHDLRALARVVQTRAETAMRDAIRALPDGVYTSEIWNNPLGEQLNYPLKLTVQDDAIELDFDGAPPQLPQGGLNCTYTYTAAHATYPMKCMPQPAGAQQRRLLPAVHGEGAGGLDPELQQAGLGQPAHARRLVHRAQHLPRAGRCGAGAGAGGNRPAGARSTSTAATASGHVYADHFFMGAGQGGSQHGDGKSALLYPTSAANTSVELMEARAPVLVMEKSFVTDSGGAGEHRGGCGVRTRLRKLHDDGLPTLASVYPEGVGVTVQGLLGGLPGGERARRGARSRRQRGARLRHRRVGHADTHRSIVEVRLAGGAGFGDPRARAGRTGGDRTWRTASCHRKPRRTTAGNRSRQAAE